MLEEKKFCKFCGKELKPKRVGKRNVKESPKVFSRRIYCDRVCMRKSHLSDESNRDTRLAHATARTKYELYLNLDKCEICGCTGKKLDVHHKDENYNNNSLDNLIALCRSCHMKQHRKIRKCSVSGCETRVKGLGFCDKHYQRYKRYGDPLVVRWNTKHTKNEVLNE